MRIFPNTSGIVVSEKANMDTDIPLAYIDTNSIEYNIDIIIENEFKTKLKKEIIPYQKISNNNITLFDKNEDQIPYNQVQESIIRDGKDYIYIPSNSRRFRPKTFAYSIIAKRHSIYNSNMPYNICALAYSCKAYANNLMSIFGDAFKKGEAPSNVTVNNGDLSLNAITNNQIMNTDITFVRLKSNEVIIEDDFMNEGETAEGMFDKDFFLDEFGANMIAFFDTSLATDGTEGINESKVLVYKSEEESEYKIEDGIIYDDISIKTKYAFNMPKQKEGIIYHNLFNSGELAPVLIEEHIKKGFFVYMSDEIINNVKDHKKIIYEVMAFIYFNRYLKSKTFTEYISDEIPDFEVKDMNLHRKIKFISKHSLDNIFALNEDEVSIEDVIINKSKYGFVEYIGMDNNYLEFKKVKDDKYKDPIIKEKDEISIYSGEEIFFCKDFMYAINDNLEDCIKMVNDNKKIDIFYNDFRHTDSSIYIKKSSEPITINLINKTRSNDEEHTVNADYFIICKPNQGITLLSVIDSKIDIPKDYIILATIKIRQRSDKTALVDMRQRGGGLPYHAKDDYNCLDIGHAYGRPYRKGGAIIITLPKKIEAHKERIEMIVKEHCAAEDYPIILFDKGM